MQYDLAMASAAGFSTATANRGPADPSIPMSSKRRIGEDESSLGANPGTKRPPLHQTVPEPANDRARMSTALLTHEMHKIYLQMAGDNEFFMQIVDTVNDHAARLTFMGVAHKAGQLQV